MKRKIKLVVKTKFVGKMKFAGKKQRGEHLSLLKTSAFCNKSIVDVFFSIKTDWGGETKISNNSRRSRHTHWAPGALCKNKLKKEFFRRDVLSL